MKGAQSVSFLVLLSIVSSCGVFQKVAITKQLEFESDFYHHHSGFALYDPEKRRFTYEYNSDKYFTPDYNTKILTMYASTILLRDSVKALEYIEKGDSLIFWGTGDPSFLNPNTYDSYNAFSFLKDSNKKLYYSESNFHDEHFGAGWAWDDYYFGFSAEKSPFPVYGNVVVFTKYDSINEVISSIPYFDKHVIAMDSTSKKATIMRSLDHNEFNYYLGPGSFEYQRPFITSGELTATLLADTLKQEVTLIDYIKPKKTNTIYSVPIDSLFKSLMQPSDNFVAEQLLMLCSNEMGDSLKVETAIEKFKNDYLFDLPDEPIWRDGSGLSRYNLLTPRSIAKLWEKLLNELGEERIFGVVAVGGESGTLKNYYKADTPYIYGKTGTLSNVHSLSGFIKTKKGRVLIFSYMNNNYPVYSSQIKPGMERLLREIYEKY